VWDVARVEASVLVIRAIPTYLRRSAAQTGEALDPLAYVKVECDPFKLVQWGHKLYRYPHRPLPPCQIGPLMPTSLGRTAVARRPSTCALA
jgi:hypothetical protein